MRRIGLAFNNYCIVSYRTFSKVNPEFIKKHQYKQQDLSNLIDASFSNNIKWSDIKKNILDKPVIGINETNINAIILKTLITSEKFDPALSLASHLIDNEDTLNLGTINGLLRLYYRVGCENKLSEENKKFIMDSAKLLYKQYKILDSITCESLLQALCVIDEWEAALKVLDDIYITNKPSHTAFSLLIATLFKNDKRAQALNLVKRSLDNERPLLHIAYQEWYGYIFRKFKHRHQIIEHLDEVNMHIAKNYVTVPQETVNMIKKQYESLGFQANFTKINRYNAQCKNCNRQLELLNLTSEEFQYLQTIVKEKLIIGSDLFLKSLPEELIRFQEFIAKNGPFDIVLDGLNIVLSLNHQTLKQKADSLLNVIEFFNKKNKKVLLLGRKHMSSWYNLKKSDVYNKTPMFFIENLSQDDPYMITAAILSGQQCDIVTRDILRGHKFKLGDETSKLIFQKWQWHHQWMVYNSRYKGAIINPPLKFTPSAQKNKHTWHIPYQDENAVKKELNDGVPDLNSWICIHK